MAKKTKRIIFITVIFFLNLTQCEWDEKISAITKEEYDQLVAKREEKKSNKELFFDKEEMILIKKDQNPSWLCNKIEDVEIKYIATLSMTENSEVYLALIKGGGKSFVRVLKLVNFEIDINYKVLDEINFGLMFETNQKFSGVINCYFDKRDGKGERISMISPFYPFNLSELILTNRLVGVSWNKKISMFLRICIGITHLHKKNIIHRDLTLENIFVNYDEMNKDYVPFVSDLGYACYEDEIKKEEIGNNVFKPQKMFNQDKYGQEVDLYALGMILYSLLSNRIPQEFIYSEDDYKNTKNFMNRNELKSQKDNTNKQQKDFSGLLPLIKWMMNSNLGGPVFDKKNAEYKNKKSEGGDLLKVEIVYWALSDYNKNGKISGFDEENENKEIEKIVQQHINIGGRKEIKTPNPPDIPKPDEIAKMKRSYLIFLRQYIINNEPSPKIASEGTSVNKGKSINNLLEDCVNKLKKTNCKFPNNQKESERCLNNFEKCYIGEKKENASEPEKIYKETLTDEMQKALNIRKTMRAAIFSKILKLNNTILI